MNQKRFSDVLGLRLTRQALRVLKERGIFAHSAVSLEHQHLAKRYVVRGLESGGAAGDVGRYVTFSRAQAHVPPGNRIHAAKSPVCALHSNAPREQRANWLCGGRGPDEA